MYVIFNYQSFNDTLTNEIVSFEQLGLGYVTSPAAQLTECPFCDFKNEADLSLGSPHYERELELVSLVTGWYIMLCLGSASVAQMPI